MEQLLCDAVEYAKSFENNGEVASYIPELAKADPSQLGICIVQTDGSVHASGHWQTVFTMQSVFKPVILLAALMDSGEDAVRRMVGMEATGKPFDAFNYSDQALSASHINPMINTGAIALCTLIAGRTYEDKFARLLELTRTLAGNDTMQVQETVFRSEKATGSKNRALA
ncbi:MAG: glutaminase, partial [Oscillospiraceae bacterium]|nr:glutaminase [Oscillospiraceae bacterium]